MFEIPHRPVGIFTYVSRLCLQGGGVYVQGGTVTLSSCTITGNTATSVRAHAQNFPSPDGKISNVLALTHACTSAANAAPVDYRGCVPQRPSKVPIAPWETHLCSLFTGRRCLCRWRHGDLLIVQHQWEPSFLCAPHAQNFPSPRWNFHLFCACACRAAVC